MTKKQWEALLEQIRRTIWHWYGWKRAEKMLEEAADLAYNQWTGSGEEDQYAEKIASKAMAEILALQAVVADHSKDSVKAMRCLRIAVDCWNYRNLAIQTALGQALTRYGHEEEGQTFLTRGLKPRSSDRKLMEEIGWQRYFLLPKTEHEFVKTQGMEFVLKNRRNGRRIKPYAIF